MKYILILFLAGCDVMVPKIPETEKPSNYKCSKENLDMLYKIFETCNKSSYQSSYCYLIAVKSFCTYIKPEINSGCVK